MRLARAGAALALAAALPLVASSPPAAGFEQEHPALVSNLSQDPTSTTGLSTRQHAQAFTTGNHAGGYLVTQVTLLLKTLSTTNSYDISINADAAAGTDGPGASLATLSPTETKPVNAFRYEARFTHAGVSLAASTTYWVVIAADSRDNLQVTDGDDQLGASGWSIADGSYYRVRSPLGNWTASSRALFVGIAGYEVPAPGAMPPGPPLSGLSVVAADGVPGALDVSWDAVSAASTTSYLVAWKGAGESYSFTPILGADGTTARVVKVGSTARTTQLTGLTPGAAYDVRVSASNGANHGVSVETTSPVAASAWALSLSSYDAGSGTFGLEAAWGAFPDATKYQVQYKGPGQEYSDTMRSKETTSTSARLSGLTVGVQYEVHVAALMGTTNPTELASVEASAVVTFEGFDAAATSVDLVSSLGVTASAGTRANAGDFDMAQAFTTGDRGWGHVLTGVGLDLSFGASRATFSVKVYEDADGAPGALAASLTAPASLANGVNTFSTVGVPLRANTVYWLVIDSTSAGTSRFSYADTSTEAGRAERGSDGNTVWAGWSVADSMLERTRTSTTAWSAATTAPSQALRLQVLGYDIALPESLLVGNMGESVWRHTREGAEDLVFRTVGFLDRAQAFTTGSNAGGYVVDGVGLQMSFGADPAMYEVSINADSGGAPGERLGVLKAPASSVSGAVRFTHEGVWLAPNSRYWLVIDGERAGDAKYALTRSATQASPAGWSVADGSLLRHDLFQGVSEASKWKAGSSATPFGVLKLGVLGEANDAWSSVSVAAPTDTTATQYKTALDVSWQAAGGTAPATGYAVEWSAVGDDGGTFAVNRVRVGANVLSRQITGLLPGTAYQVRVVAEGGSRDGDAVYASEPVSTNPWVPGVSYDFHPSGFHSFNVGWDAIPSAAGYVVQWRSPGQEYNTMRSVRATAGLLNASTDSTLVLGESYWLRVGAVSTGSPLGVSEEVQARLVAPIAGLTVTPSAPGAAGALQVTWDAPSPPLAGATHYLVSKTEGPLEGDRSVPCVDVDGAVQPCAEADLPVPCADDDGVISRGYDVFDSTSLTLPVTAGRRYRVCVSARTRNGDTLGAASGVVVAVPAAASVLSARPVPGDPTGLYVDWSDLALGWSDVAAGSPFPVEGYRVRWRADDESYDDSGNERQQDTEPSVTRYRIGGLAELGGGQRYSVQVTALHTVGDQKTEGASAEVTYKKPSVPSPGSGARVAAPVSDEAGGPSSSSTAGGTVILANGWSPADIAVAAALSAGIDGSTVAYTRADTLAEPTKQLLSEHRPARLIVVGGNQAVTPAAARAAQQAAHSGRAERIQGADRAATAAAAARRAWQSTPASERTAIIANGWSAADTAAAAALAARTPAAAVAFVAADKLSQATADLLSEQQPARIIVIGGTQAVADSVAAAARAAAEVPAAAVTRLAGDTRADTAAQIARRVLSGAPAGSATIVIANGHSPSDIGVAASAAARTPRAAVLYTAPGDTPQATLDLLREHRPARVVIIGGAQAVSTQITDTIRAAVGASTRVVRYTGATRIHTSTQTAQTVLTLR